jgi:DNA-binding GntR family transcriptional regulator
MKKYKILRDTLKRQIQLGEFKKGDLLPSENDLCKTFTITRTTARKALDELLKEGFIEKLRGKGSRVTERRKSLGLLNVKGFSEAVGANVTTIYLQKPVKSEWNGEIFSIINSEDRQQECIFFERLRCVGDIPVMHEKNWFPAQALPGFLDSDFVEGSFFKTLSQKYSIEIKGSSQELRAEFASAEQAKVLNIANSSPLLHISVKFYTSNPLFNIYSELYCNTEKYPVGNSYFL